jgi:hypothetical protein
MSYHTMFIFTTSMQPIRAQFIKEHII